MMRDDKLIELFEFYATKGADMPVKLDEPRYALKRRDFIDISGHELITMSTCPRHAAWMATQAIGFVREAQALDEQLGATTFPAEVPALIDKIHSKREKAHRWLGFIQGVLWMAGVFSLDELKEHSRRCSDEPEKPETTNG